MQVRMTTTKIAINSCRDPSVIASVLISYHAYNSIVHMWLKNEGSKKHYDVEVISLQVNSVSVTLK